MCRGGATRGAMVTTSAFLACHPCYSEGSSLGWGWNFQALACGISEARRQRFKCNFNSVKLNGGSVPSYHVAHDMLHVLRARCVARELHKIVT